LSEPVLLPPRVVNFVGCFKDQLVADAALPAVHGLSASRRRRASSDVPRRRGMYPIGGMQLGERVLVQRQRCLLRRRSPSRSTSARRASTCAADLAVQELRALRRARCEWLCTRACAAADADLARVCAASSAARIAAARAATCQRLGRSRVSSMPPAPAAARRAGVSGWSLVGVRGYVATNCACPLCGARRAGWPLAQQGACWCLATRAAVESAARRALVTRSCATAACAQPTTLPCGGATRSDVSVFEMLQGDIRSLARARFFLPPSSTMSSSSPSSSLLALLLVSLASASEQQVVAAEVVVGLDELGDQREFLSNKWMKRWTGCRIACVTMSLERR
jgi:hypothetical protein